MSICNRNRIMTGLRFLFRVTLRRLDLAEEIYHIREPHKLPLVMSVDEIKRLLAVASSLKARVMFRAGFGSLWVKTRIPHLGLMSAPTRCGHADGTMLRARSTGISWKS
jgi:hypothetical protein